MRPPRAFAGHRAGRTTAFLIEDRQRSCPVRKPRLRSASRRWAQGWRDVADQAPTKVNRPSLVSGPKLSVSDTTFPARSWLTVLSALTALGGMPRRLLCRAVRRQSLAGHPRHAAGHPAIGWSPPHRLLSRQPGGRGQATRRARIPQLGHGRHHAAAEPGFGRTHGRRVRVREGADHGGRPRGGRDCDRTARRATDASTGGQTICFPGCR